MSYISGNQREVSLVRAGSLTALAAIGGMTCGLQPFVLRQVAVVFTTAATAAGIVVIKKRPTAGSAAGETVVATINFDNLTGLQGRSIYKDDLTVKFVPGDELIVEVTDVSAAGIADVKALIEESWEAPQNNTDMLLTT